MAHNVPQQYLFLLRGEDPGKALERFKEFVKSTGGNDANVNNDLDLFYQWRDSLNPVEDGVLFTRSSHGPNGEMTAKVLTPTRELKSQTNIPRP